MNKESLQQPINIRWQTSEQYFWRGIFYIDGAIATVLIGVLCCFLSLKLAIVVYILGTLLFLRGWLLACKADTCFWRRNSE